MEIKQPFIYDKFRGPISCSRDAGAQIMNNLRVYIKRAQVFLDLKLSPWKLLEMKDKLISNISVSQFCEKTYIFQITRGCDDIFKQGWGSQAQSYTKDHKIKRKIIFSQNGDTLLLEIILSFISGRFRISNCKYRKTGAHFM